MGYREIVPEDFDITEPVSMKTQAKKTKFSLNKINISMNDLYSIVIYGFIGLLFIWIGVTNAGSYYMPGTRLGEPLSTFFYSWQMGTIFIVIGCLILYHSIIGSGRKWM